MYPSDLTDKEWQGIEHFFKRPDPRGARSKHDKRSIVNAIIYVVKGGIQWRMLPTNFPPWQTVYNHFWRLNERGIWEQVLQELNKINRVKSGRKPHPSYALVDSQTVKTQYHGKDRGYDGGKKN
jgi:putative transposase